MQPSDLYAQFRKEMDDAVPDYLWDDDSLAWYLSQAQNEYAKRTRCIPATHQETLAPGTDTVPVPEDWFDVISAMVDDDPLHEIPYDQVWGRAARTGTPREYSLNLNLGAMWVYPSPAVATTVTMRGFVAPPVVLATAGLTGLQIPVDHHHDLLVGMRAYAYKRHDPDTYDATQARRFEADWERILRSGYSLHNIRLRQSGKVCYGGI